MLRDSFLRSGVGENGAEIINWLSYYEVSGKRDDEVALVFAHADAGWIDECAWLTVVVCVFHVCNLLKCVNGFGVIPFSHQDLKRGDLQNSGDRGFLSWSK